MKRKRAVVISLLIVFAAILIAIIGVKAHIEANLKSLSDLVITNVDLSQVEDGAYTGSCKVFPVAAEVEVTVRNHMIRKIELKRHVNGQGLPAEVIPQKVVEAQTLEVDIVSGATYSSKVILKAIENALNNTDKK